MHVGLNLVYLVPGETGGMERYARELVPALVAAAPGLTITAFVNREAADAGLTLADGVRNAVVPVHARSRVQWVSGEQLHLPRMARQAGVDVLHSLGSTSPAYGRFTRVSTIHDLLYRRFRNAHTPIRTLGMRVLIPLSARRSDRIIAISTSTAHDLAHFLGVPPAKIDLIPSGHGDPPRALIEPEPEAEVRLRWRLGDRSMILALSARRPVKNLERLLEALAIVPVERRPVLVMPGYPTPFEARLRDRIGELDLGDDVRMPGAIAERQLEGLWRTATCFVFPSLYEGFGAPVLEAMRRGVPVACSDRGSLPEVAGEAALFFDPEQPAAIAGAIEELLGDERHRRELVRQGFAQADRFTWERTARLTLESYDRALSARPARSPRRSAGRPAST